jgi:hypothetical protein
MASRRSGAAPVLIAECGGQWRRRLISMASAGEHLLSIYQFNTLSAKHYFCSKCGIYTHHQRRSDPTQFGINVACLEGVSPFDFAEVPVFDGVNHPNDARGITRLAGTLRFIRREPD